MKVEIPDILGLAREDLACYCTAQWPQFEMAAHHRVILDKLEAVGQGEINRLMLFLPPRHGKSLLTSQFFPAWFMGHHPDSDVIFITYGQELSDDFGRRVRNLVADPLHQAIFPGCRLSEDSTAAHRFNTTRGGAYFAVGRGGPITGRGADLLIVDDPIKDREEANSETIRRNLHEWFVSVALTRPVPNGAVILVQTRWHEDDLAGWLLREHADDGWEIVSLPAIAEVDESFRSAGEALWPQRFSLEALQQIGQAVGSATWESLYQQRPAAAEGALFKRDWWRYYREHPACSRIVQSWDTAFKKGSESDYSVCTTWYVIVGFVPFWFFYATVTATCYGGWTDGGGLISQQYLTGNALSVWIMSWFAGWLTFPLLRGIWHQWRWMQEARTGRPMHKATKHPLALMATALAIAVGVDHLFKKEE